MIPGDVKIVGVDLFDEDHILIDFSNGKTHKYNIAELRTIHPVEVNTHSMPEENLNSLTRPLP